MNKGLSKSVFYTKMYASYGEWGIVNNEVVTTKIILLGVHLEA